MSAEEGSFPPTLFTSVLHYRGGKGSSPDPLNQCPTVEKKGSFHFPPTLLLNQCTTVGGEGSIRASGVGLASHKHHSQHQSLRRGAGHASRKHHPQHQSLSNEVRQDGCTKVIITVLLLIIE